MSSSFFGFTIGVRALSASQKALEVIGHNIANINTEGHSRQKAVMETTEPEGLPSINRGITAGQVGSGVKVSEVRRLHDEYIENQMIDELQNSGKWDASLKAFEKIETIFAEPSENGLRNMMDIYWNSWKNLESSPEDFSARKSLVENSKSFCNLIKSMNSRLKQLRSDLDTEITTKAEAINNYADQISELNALIKEVSIAGDNPNDLMDRRDNLIKDMSKLINIDVRQTDFNQVNIFVGGNAIVRKSRSRQIEAVDNPVTGFRDIKWEGTDRLVSIENGELYSMLNFRDDYIGGVLDKLDQLASNLITETNNIHSSGFGLDGSTGNDFFIGTGVDDIDINPDIYNNMELIAASSEADQPGNNSNAIQISGLRNEELLEGGTLTIDEYYNNMVVQIGIETQQCIREQENTNLLIDKINMRRESVSGVSLDDELMNMVKYQHSYNAAARVINTMDELFETLIREMA